MRYVINSILVSMCAMISSASTAQSLSNKGRVFWVGYGHHQFMEPGGGNSQEMILYFSAEQPARVVVTIRGTAYREVYDVPANSVISSKPLPKGLESPDPSVIDSRLFTLPPSYGGTGSEGVFSSKGIRIESDVPIVAYAHIYGSLSSGASMLMPEETWGYSYTALNTRQYFGNSNFTCFSWLYIVARRNNTRIRITPSVSTRNGRPANIPFDITLQEGDVFQLVGNHVSANEGLDLTGTVIQSIANNQGECFPVAVFTGSSRTSVTCTGAPEGSGDNIMQQLFPYQAWGKKYLTTPTHIAADIKNRNINVFRIAVRDRSTVVKKNGMVLQGLNGFYYEYQSNTTDFIEADKPILVAQYLPSQSACNYSGIGDPELIYLSPVEQAITQTAFYRNNKEDIKYNFLSLTIPDKGLSSLTIDGARDFTHVYPQANMPGYSVVIKRWTAAQTQSVVKSDSAFNAITYGLGNAESYGYNAGTLINNLNGMAAIKNEYNRSDSFNTHTCINSPVALSLLMRYQPTKIQWKLSRLSAVVTPATDVSIDNPIADEQIMINGISYYRYTLPGSFRFLQTGIHSIPVFTTHPSVDVCDNTEMVQYAVTVKLAPIADFNITYENCKPQEEIFFSTGKRFTNGTVAVQWDWIFTGGIQDVTGVGNETRQTFDSGRYMARLIAADSNGCIADTSKSFTLADKPARPDFSVSVQAVCESGEVRFQELQPEAGVKSWYWNFGNGQEHTSTANGALQTTNYPDYGTATVKHVVKFSETCMSDTAIQQITVHARPRIQISYPSDCLPVNGLVQFRNNNIVPDGQTISNHSWNFGDAAATPDNPNTSSEPEPAHVFAYGPYAIRYSASTEMGCTSDTLMNAQFNLRPLFSYADPVLPPVCALANQRISVANAIVTNGVPGSGIYKGRGVDPGGGFNAAIAGPGTHQIWFVYTSSAGCTDSVSSNINVVIQPSVNAGPDVFVAAGTKVNLNGHASPGTGMAVRWSPGSLLTNPTILQPGYQAYKDQEFILTATEATGLCKASDTMQVRIFRPVKVPNAFSPNGDGIHDKWDIPYLNEYSSCEVDVFNRYGQTVFRSRGYGKPWDGNYNGHTLPAGTYYYLIDLKNGFGRLSGSVTIVR